MGGDKAVKGVVWMGRGREGERGGEWEKREERREGRREGREGRREGREAPDGCMRTVIKGPLRERVACIAMVFMLLSASLSVSLSSRSPL